MPLCKTCQLGSRTHEPHIPCSDCGAVSDWGCQSQKFEEFWKLMQLEGKKLNTTESKLACRLAWLGGYRAGRDEPKGGI